MVDEVTGSGLESDREMIEMILSPESATRKAPNSKGKEKKSTKFIWRAMRQTS